MGRIVCCKAGSFAGFEENGVVHFKGIRYADSERFDKPVPYTYPEGVHEMRTNAPFAVHAMLWI